MSIFALKMKVAPLCPTLFDPMDYTGSSVHGDSPGKNTGVGCHSLLQGIFPTQRMNSGLPHCRRILYQLSHMGSPRILEWVAYPFSRGSSWPRNWTGVSCTAGGFLTSWATREALCTLLPNSDLNWKSRENHQTIQVWLNSNPLQLFSGSEK